MQWVLFLGVSLLFGQTLLKPEIPFTKETLMGGGQTALGLQKLTGGLLDPTRFFMQQSYSVSYATNGTQSDMNGLYLNRMTYQFELPLTLQVDLGFSQKPMALFGEQQLEKGQKPLNIGIPHASLTWQPSKKFMMSVHYFQYNPNANTSLFYDPDYDPLQSTSPFTALRRPLRQ